jgi:hypothetical protein
LPCGPRGITSQIVAVQLDQVEPEPPRSSGEVLQSRLGTAAAVPKVIIEAGHLSYSFQTKYLGGSDAIETHSSETLRHI